jgi:hypothetical protein
MRIVFSRKGVDSAAGRCASPLVDGRPISLPIPTGGPTPTNYGDLAAPLPLLASHLSGGQLAAGRPCHLDPDIDQAALAGRPPDWRGALGQVSAALSHLRNQGVGPGDLFLFWGLFRPATLENGRWRYSGGPVHALFGWLEVAEVLDLGDDGGAAVRRHPWLCDHPHARSGWGRSNGIYVAAERLGIRPGLPGSGTFARAVPLTAPGAATLTDWLVPDWLHPHAGGTGMSYHPARRWRDGGRLTAAARGQEFVANVGGRRDARDWAAALIEEAAS